MRSNRKILFGVLILVAVVVLFVIFKGISNSVSNQVATNPPPGTGNGNVRTVSTGGNGGKIAVAAYDIPARSIITPDMLKMVDHAGTNEGFITDPDVQANGFITRVGLPKGAQIRPNDDFVGYIGKVGIKAAIQPGMRALVIPIANKPTFHDLVGVGDYVDVLASFDSQESRPIVQGVRVLAVDIFGADYPAEKSIAKHGPYKAPPLPADAAAAPAGPVPAPADPNATPTPGPTPPPANTPRPDAAITLEVTQEQAAAIQLAQQSGASLDYLLLPAGEVTGGPTNQPLINAEGTPMPTPEGGVTTVSVTKAEIAPYAERKKAQPGGAAPAPSRGGGNDNVRTVSTGRGGRIGGFSSPNIPLPTRSDQLPTVQPFVPGANGGNTTSGAPSFSRPTYTIPVYADSQPVRTDTVLQPSADQ